MISEVDSPYATKAYGKVEVYFHPFLATTLDTGCQVHVPIVLRKDKDPPILNEQKPRWVPGATLETLLQGNVTS